MVVFDADKDALNRAKHGISLARAADFEVQSVVLDGRFEEPRKRAYGLIDGRFFCLAYVERDGQIRAISLRRAHLKEVRRHVRES